MNRQDEGGLGYGAHEQLAQVREQVGILAEQVGRLIDVIACQDARGDCTRLAEEKLEVLETLMWKLHQRQSRLKAGAVDRRKLN
ncbi:MAG: hypothetical protein EON61_01425 [Alphaproteobacteria bacterium]|jgi:hypothetical protein|nr:MAG: hypothetical protein EON61_01425 [Alphaproteobacteria bacterium]